MAKTVNTAEGVKQALVSLADLAAVIVVATVPQIFAGFAPKGAGVAGPYIVMSRISGKQESSNDGDDGLEDNRWQLFVGGQNKVQVDLVVRILERQLNGFDFVYTEATVPYTLNIFHVNSMEYPFDSEQQDYTTIVDISVWINT